MAKPQQKQATKKETTYLWEGTDRRGNVAKGDITAMNIAIAKAMLRKQGINPKKVRKKQAPLFARRPKPVKPLDIATFTRQMATMMKSGVPLVESFDLCSESLDNPSMKTLLTNLKNDVAGGNSFSSAVRNQPLYFDDLYCNLVEAGEQSGSLETMLDRLALYKEKTEALKSKIKSAMKYPAIVLVVAIIVTAIILIKVVPVFTDLFESFGAELPWLTQQVVSMSNLVVDSWYILLFGGVSIVLGYVQLNKRSKPFREAQDRFFLRAPVFGGIVRTAAVARFARTLSTTFSAGVPLVEALESAAGASGNIVYRNAIFKIRDDVTAGGELNVAMRLSGIFPPMLNQFTAIGEHAGSLDEMLGRAATIYEDEVDTAVDGLTSMMEPMIMAFLGVVIGGLVIAMYLPIFQIGDAF